VFARASKEIDAKRKFDPSSMRVEDDGAVVGTCAGSRPEDAYDVRVRVRGKDGSDETDGADGAAEVEHEAPLVDVSCTCPAAKAQARGGAPPQFGARTAAPPKAQPPRSCKHSAALLLWRARTLAADVDPDASRAETTAATRTTTTERPDERLDDERPVERENNEAVSLRAPPPPRPAAAPPRSNAKRRRLPPSLAQSAAAAAEAAAKRARRPAGESLAGGRGGDGSVRERAKNADEEKERTKKTSVARNPSAARAAVKREPGLGRDARNEAAGAADDANGHRRTTNGSVSSSGVSGASGRVSLVSLADREIVAKMQTIDDAALLAAARRAMLGESANERSSAAIANAEPFVAGSASEAPSPPRSSRADPRPPPEAQMRAAPAMKDMFASFLPAAFKAPAAAPAPSAPAPALAAGDASLEKTQPAGTARPVSIAKPAAFTETAPSAGVAVSTGAVGGAPAAEVEGKEGPKKMSFAELVASGGL
jgi:hypothetical protein